MVERSNSGRWFKVGLSVCLLVACADERSGSSDSGPAPAGEPASSSADAGGFGAAESGKGGSSGRGGSAADGGGRVSAGAGAMARAGAGGRNSAGAGGMARAGAGGRNSAGAADAGSGGGSDGGATGSNSVSKRGLAYAIKTSGDMTALSSGISWWYNWSPKPDTDLSKVAPNVEFVPMIWGSNFNLDQLATQIPAGSKYLLTFNEPNFGSQANVTPQKAAQLWPDIQKFANDHHLKLVSPAVNYCGGSCNETSPFDWLDAFFAACKDCQVDYVAVHWYACSKSALTGYLGQFESKYGKPLWLTEFSCLDGSLAATTANESKYALDALAALEADPMVFRYAWFTGRSADTPALDLLAADGKLTPLGQTYLDFPH